MCKAGGPLQSLDGDRVCTLYQQQLQNNTRKIARILRHVSGIQALVKHRLQDTTCKSQTRNWPRGGTHTAMQGCVSLSYWTAYACNGVLLVNALLRGVQVSHLACSCMACNQPKKSALLSPPKATQQKLQTHHNLCHGREAVH